MLLLDLILGLLFRGSAELARAGAGDARRRGVGDVDRRVASADRDAAARLETEGLLRVGEQRLALAGDALRRAHLERVGVHDDVGLGGDLDVAVALDLDDLVDRVEDELVLLGLVDDRDLLGALLVVEDDPVAAARLDQLGVVLGRVIDLDRLLLLAPQRADHDRPVDVAVLEHHEQLVVDLRQEVGAAIGAAHRHRDPRPERRLLVIEPGELDLDAVPGVALSVLVVDDDGELHASDLRGPLRLRHHAVDG
ncbi:MAG: hypothetical protein E6J90_24490 [Deltaproteobacteria bacterium]|nr:MAG: hypothetical protein E6J90_24490 [Deltaproteobacteria bacterium]